MVRCSCLCPKFSSAPGQAREGEGRKSKPPKTLSLIKSRVTAGSQRGIVAKKNEKEEKGKKSLRACSSLVKPPERRATRTYDTIASKLLNIKPDLEPRDGTKPSFVMVVTIAVGPNDTIFDSSSTASGDWRSLQSIH